MRFAIPLALILALLCGCGGSSPAPAAVVQGVAGERSADAQEENLLEDCLAPHVEDLDTIQDLLRDLFGEFDYDLDDIRGDERPGGDERPDFPAYELEGPDLDLLRGAATWTLLVNLDEDRDLEPLLKVTIRFEDERGNPTIPFDISEPPEDLEDALEDIPDGTTLVVEWELLDLIEAQGELRITFARGTIVEVSGMGTAGDDVCVLSWSFSLGLDDFMSEHPMFEIEFELETPGGTAVGSINFIDDDLALITYKIDEGGVMTKYLDLETGEISDRPPVDDDRGDDHPDRPDGGGGDERPGGDER